MPDSLVPDRPIPSGRIQLGVIGRPHGVRGLVKVNSHTANPADLTAYGPLSDADGRCYALRWRAEGVAEVARIVDGLPVKVTDRSHAEKLTNTKLFIERSALPPPDEEEYYLTDLIGIAAVDKSGSTIGTVSVVHDYGAGASLEIERKAGGPLIIPFTAACVPTVDISGGRLFVVVPAEIVVAPDADQGVVPSADQGGVPGGGQGVAPDAVQGVAPDAGQGVAHDADQDPVRDVEAPSDKGQGGAPDLVVSPNVEPVVAADAVFAVPPRVGDKAA